MSSYGDKQDLEDNKNFHSDVSVSFQDLWIDFIV